MLCRGTSTSRAALSFDYTKDGAQYIYVKSIIHRRPSFGYVVGKRDCGFISPSSAALHITSRKYCRRDRDTVEIHTVEICIRSSSNSRSNGIRLTFSILISEVVSTAWEFRRRRGTLKNRHIDRCREISENRYRHHGTFSAVIT